MFFLSAQPDDYYFTWQLELQLFNFMRLGIPPNDIHVLIGYNIKRGLRAYFQEFIKRNIDKASFYTYPDNRVNKEYLSSLRPHIIQQHLSKFPSIQNEAIFYHDSDIIFRELPDFYSLLNDNIWYVSDTRNYLDSDSLVSG